MTKKKGSISFDIKKNKSALKDHKIRDMLRVLKYANDVCIV